MVCCFDRQDWSCRHLYIHSWAGVLGMYAFSLLSLGCPSVHAAALLCIQLCCVAVAASDFMI
jgi:hypothetical protein